MFAFAGRNRFISMESLRDTLKGQKPPATLSHSYIYPYISNISKSLWWPSPINDKLTLLKYSFRDEYNTEFSPRSIVKFQELWYLNIVPCVENLKIEMDWWSGRPEPEKIFVHFLKTIQ
jgi:hypothetical protein